MGPVLETATKGDLEKGLDRESILMVGINYIGRHN
jgi:hypothetical protein